MQIIHKLDNFLYTIFPSVKKGDIESLKIEIQKYYTYGSYKPIVQIEDIWVIINIDMPSITSDEAAFKKVISLCEKGRYAEAKPILENLISKNPSVSEYHRIKGQILSDEGDNEGAIDCLIDALCWDPKNSWALLMMGNILAKYRNDIPTAMTYYDQALKINPKDNITINNIGANLMEQGKLAEAKKYFNKALNINDNYPNTHYALGLIAEIENNLQSSFNYLLDAIKKNRNHDILFQNSVKQAFEVAQKIIQTNIGEKIYKDYKRKLELEDNRKIEIIQDDEIMTAAKFELAENHNRENHVIRYRANYPAIEHLIMHELVHLDFILKARKENVNQLFIITDEHKKDFIKGLKPTIDLFSESGYSEESILDYCSHLFEGMNRQVFNAPIDLLIENYLYNEYLDLRPFQFLSLYKMLQEGLDAVTNEQVIEIAPKDIISKSRVYNIVNGFQFKELYGLDFTNDYKANKKEMSLAKGFYDEFIEYREDKEPGEEYELVLNWAKDLNLDNIFKLENENTYRESNNIDSFIKSFLNDPLGIDEKDQIKERAMREFQKSQSEIKTNMAVVMFMVDALKFFEGKDREEIRKTALEIAMQGTQGYSPNNDNYIITSIPNKRFSGYHILAYYYVSWALSIPEMLSKLELPYDEEYKLAQQLHK